MDRSRCLVALGFVLAAVTAAGWQQPTGEPFSRAIKELKPGLFVIPGYDGQVTGGNIAVRVTNDGALIVDSAFGAAAKEVAPKVRSVTSQPIRYLLSTHSHNDHTGGNPLFPATELVGHANTRVNMVKGKQEAPPRVVFNDRLSVFLGDVEVRAVHLGRGHTNGDAVIYFPDLRVVHTGDLVVWGQRTDKSILTPFADTDNGGSLVEWIPTIDKLLEIDFDLAIPGHGPALTKNDIRAYRQKLETLRQRIAEQVRAGTTKAQLASRLKVDDLNWPIPQARLDQMFDDVATHR